SSRSRWRASWSRSTPASRRRSRSTPCRRHAPDRRPTSGRYRVGVPSRPAPPVVLRWTLLLGIWAFTAVLVGSALFLNSTRTTVLAGHDAVVTPTLEGHAVLATGPVLPDVRMDVPGQLGVRITLGKTEVDSTEELFSRYALIASNSEAQIAKVRGLVVEMAIASVLRGVAAGAIPVVIYLILGPTRRADLAHGLRNLHLKPLLGASLVIALVLALWQPWYGEEAE